jgi:hypothetical protein
MAAVRVVEQADAGNDPRPTTARSGRSPPAPASTPHVNSVPSLRPSNRRSSGGVVRQQPAVAAAEGPTPEPWPSDWRARPARRRRAAGRRAEHGGQAGPGRTWLGEGARPPRWRRGGTVATGGSRGRRSRGRWRAAHAGAPKPRNAAAARPTAGRGPPSGLTNHGVPGRRMVPSPRSVGAGRSSPGPPDIRPSSAVSRAPVAGARGRESTLFAVLTNHGHLLGRVRETCCRRAAARVRGLLARANQRLRRRPLSAAAGYGRSTGPTGAPLRLHRPQPSRPGAPSRALPWQRHRHYARAAGPAWLCRDAIRIRAPRGAGCHRPADYARVFGDAAAARGAGRGERRLAANGAAIRSTTSSPRRRRAQSRAGWPT